MRIPDLVLEIRNTSILLYFMLHSSFTLSFHGASFSSSSSEPRIIESARRRAMEQEKKRKAKVAMETAKALEEMTVKSGDETKTKEQLQKDLESREKLPKEESSEVLAKYKISKMQILDSYSPMYEFED